jgi:hypothetical protein
MIFLSYSWEDSEAARSLHRELTESGLETWIDFEQLDLRSDIASQIEAAVRASHALLFLDTPNARLSKWAQFEKSIAETAQIPVLRVEAIPGRFTNSGQRAISPASRHLLRVQSAMHELRGASR